MGYGEKHLTLTPGSGLIRSSRRQQGLPLPPLLARLCVQLGMLSVVADWRQPYLVPLCLLAITALG